MSDGHHCHYCRKAVCICHDPELYRRDNPPDYSDLFDGYEKAREYLQSEVDRLRKVLAEQKEWERVSFEQTERNVQLEAQVRELEAERDELRQTLDLIRSCDMRAIKRWQDEKPGRELTHPDRTEMIVWLLSVLDRMGEENDELLIGQAADVAIGESVSKSAKQMNGIVREVATYLGIETDGKFPTRTQIMNRATQLQAAEQRNADLVEELAIARKWILIHSAGWSGDWACVQCKPHSDMLIEGFVCAVHQAKSALKE